MVSLSVNPVGSWWLVAAFAAVVTGLTVWAYWRRIQTTRGAWRWFALGLRLAAILLCLIAALRPSVVFQEKKKQPASLLFLVDDSSSMTITDEARGQSRWDVARKTLDDARVTVKSLGEGLNAKYYRFDSALKDDAVDSKNPPPPPEGRETALGQNLLDALRREAGTRVAAFVVLSDGANNSGLAPLVAARQLKAQQVPVVTVGYGSENVGTQARDIAVRDLVAGPTGFVKNQLQVKGTLLVRGFAKETLEVELMVDGDDRPVDTQRIRVPADVEALPISGLKFVPKTPGEKKVTLRVKPNPNERLQSNNEMSTYVTILKGGLNVLFVQGPSAPWEPKYWLRSVGASPDIQADLKVLRKPAGESGELKNEDFAAGKYDVYVLSDLPANFLTDAQQALLEKNVERGAGLIMLGGRSSFGPGGWARSPVARVMPTTMSRNDPQKEPPKGVKFVPNTRGLDNFLFQIAAGRPESQRLWEGLPPLAGISGLGEPKPLATVYAHADGDRGEPVMVGAEAGQGRTLSFGGETWHWTRDLERGTSEGILAHRKFWRQVIFWLAHKEDKGENEVKLTLNARRIAAGQKLDFGVTAKDAKGEPLPDVKLEAQVESVPDAAKPFSTPVEVFGNGEAAKGSFLSRQAPPGEYKMTVVAKGRDGKEVGRDNARFLVYQDDRELENPAADLGLLRQVAEASGGESLPPERLGDYLKGLKGKVFTESTSLTERKVWDNWPFFLLFVTLLTLEWFIRKRHGWV